MNARKYEMSNRTEAAERTAERIVDAMLARLRYTPYDQVRLEDIAADSGVTAQTVIRRFGGKPALMTSTVERELGRIIARREAAIRSGAEQTIGALVEHYEEYGLLILKTYSEAPLVPGLPEIVARGRSYHVDWCRRAFAEDVAPGPDERTRERRLAQIVAICDATTWRILRFDGGLDAAATREALSELLLPLLR
jgi:AcrR family transcriptional regulator